MVKLPPKSTEVASGVIQAPQTINRPRYIRRFLADERNLWGHLKRYPNTVSSVHNYSSQSSLTNNPFNIC